jgi:hypothetical protein
MKRSVWIPSGTIAGRNSLMKQGLSNSMPRWYLKEFAQVFGVRGQSVQKMSVKLGVTRKKTFTYSEKSEEKREEYLNRPARIPKEDRVYVSD